MKFKYKASNGSGEIVENSREAQDKSTLYHDLKQEGFTLISAQEEKESKKFSFDIALFSRIKTHEKIIFARNLASMLDAGLALSRAFTIIQKQTKNKKLKNVLEHLIEDIKSGKSFNEALKAFPKVFSPLFISMVAAGEESGKLAESLKVISSQMEKTYVLQKKIKGALMYPSIIVFAMVVIAIFMFLFIVPSLTGTFKELNVELPVSTQFIIAISDFMQNSYLIGIAGLIALIVLFITAIHTAKGKRILDFILLRIPLIGPLVKETNSARTARTLSSLLESGVSVVQALRIVGEVIQNSYYKEILAKAEKSIQVGEPMSVVFTQAEQYYPVFVGEMMAVGEETGELGGMLLKIAAFYEDEVEQKTKDMSTVIEPFLMLVVGGAVGFFAISMISPMYSLVEHI